MTGIFSNFNLKFDPWRPDYGLGFQPMDSADSFHDLPAKIDAAVELPVKKWRPLEPQDLLFFPQDWSITFVDGVRRLELRTISEHDGRIWFGGLGSICAGGVELRPDRLNCVSDCLRECSVKRFIFVEEVSEIPHQIDLSTQYSSGMSVTYFRKTIHGLDPDEALNALQIEMRVEEGIVAGALATGDGANPALIIADGPLSLPLMQTNVVGFIKSLYRLYLDSALHQALYDLKPGQRTPLFRILPLADSGDSTSRYSCYLRLAYGLAKHSSFAGLARVEVSDSVEIAEARRLVDACAVLLPKFSTPYGRDPRAPSNLLPLAALENQLKHQMGDLKLIQRVLEEQFY